MKKLMSNRLTALLLVLFSVSFSGCFFNESDEEPSTIAKNAVGVNKEVLELPVGASSQTFDVLAPLDWTITADGLDESGDGGWYTVSKLADRGNATITVTTQNNLTGQDRQAVLTVKGKFNEVALPLKQAADGPQVLEVDKTTMQFLVVPTASQKFTVTAEFGFTVTTKDAQPAAGTPAWFTVTPASAATTGDVEVTLTPNGTGAQRKVTIVVTSPTGKEKTITVTQDNTGAGMLDTAPAGLNFEVLATAPQTFSITSPFDWTITAPGLTGTTVSGYTLSAVAGNGNATITVTPSANGTGAANNVTLTVTAAGQTKTIDLQQAADGPGVLDVTQSLTEFASVSATNQTVSVVSAFNWSIDPTEVAAATAAGFTISPTSGNGSATAQTITISAADNTTTNVRTAGFSIANSAKTSAPISLSQAASTLTVSLATLPEFTALNPTAQTFDITTPLAWTIDATAAQTAGFTVSPLSGTGNQTVTVSIANNATTLPITAQLTVSDGGGTINKTVDLSQAAGVFSVSLTSLSEFAVVSATQQTFTITSTFDWTIDNTAAAAAGFTVSPLTGTASATPQTITVDAADNGTGLARAAQLSISAGSLTPLTVDLSQAADGTGLLDVTYTPVDFASASATSQTIGVVSAFAWQIEATSLAAAQAAGFSFNNTSGAAGSTVITVSASDNTTGSPRTATINITNSGKSVPVTLTQESN